MVRQVETCEKRHFRVIPAQEEIQKLMRRLDSRFHGSDKSPGFGRNSKVSSNKTASATRGRDGFYDVDTCSYPISVLTSSSQGEEINFNFAEVFVDRFKERFLEGRYE